MQAYQKYFILFFFSLVPFCFFASVPLSAKIASVHMGHHYALVIACLGIIGAFIRNKWITLFFLYAAAWMVLIFVLKQLNPSIPAIAVANAFDATLYMLVGGAIFLCVYHSDLSKEAFYNVICVTSIIQAVIAVLQRFGFDPVLWLLNLSLNAVPLLDVHTMTGTLGNNNFLGAYLAISMPFFFRRNWTYALILIVPVLYLTQTTSAVVPALIGVMFYVFDRVKGFYQIAGIIAAAVVASLAYALFNHTPFYSNPRWADWWFALRQLFVHPIYVLIGMGPGAGWGKIYPMHNEWLQCFHQFGFVGFSLLAGYVLTIYRGNRILFTAFLIAAINMIGNYSLHLAPSAFLIIIVAGLIERERTALKRRSDLLQAC